MDFITVSNLSVERMKWSICEESASSSSSEDDGQPILTQSSSGNLSIIIEESHLENGVESDSSCSISTSKYMSSFDNGSLSNISSLSSDDQHENNHDQNGIIIGGNTTEQCYKESNRQNFDETNDRSTSLDIGYQEEIQVNNTQISRVNTPLQQQTISPDMNHRSKVFAQLLMNIALFAANINQLKYLIESYQDRPLFYVSLTFIITSLVVQLMVKIFLMINYSYDVNDRNETQKAERINNCITIAILVIALINVGITGVILIEMKGFERDSN